jgi:hypothetical protein
LPAQAMWLLAYVGVSTSVTVASWHLGGETFLATEAIFSLPAEAGACSVLRPIERNRLLLSATTAFIIAASFYGPLNTLKDVQILVGTAFGSRRIMAQQREQI